MSNPLCKGDFVKVNGDEVAEAGHAKVYVITTDADDFEIGIAGQGETKTVKRWEVKKCSAFGDEPETLYPAWMVS